MKSSCEYVLWTLSLASLIQAHASPRAESVNILPRQSTGSVPRPALGSVPYGSIITTCATTGTVALTYDDGPGPYTSQLLDTLSAAGVKATFFILGNAAVKYPDLITRMVKEGHQVASHTYDHQSLESLSSSARTAEMTQNEAVFKNILGFWPTYMRPPYGFCYGPSGCLSDMGKLGYHVIDWNVDTKDYQNDSPSLIQNAKNNWDAAFLSSSPSSSSFIPLTHDIHQNTVNTLAPYMIAEIKQKGFKFATVGECLGDPAENWYRDATSGGKVNNKAVKATGAANSTVVSTMTSSASSSSSSSATSLRIVTTASFSGITNATSTSASASVSATATTAKPSATSSTSNGVQLTISLTLSMMLAMLFMLVQA